MISGCAMFHISPHHSLRHSTYAQFTPPHSITTLIHSIAAPAYCISTQPQTIATQRSALEATSYAHRPATCKHKKTVPACPQTRSIQEPLRLIFQTILSFLVKQLPQLHGPTNLAQYRDLEIVSSLDRKRVALQFHTTLGKCHATKLVAQSIDDRFANSSERKVVRCTNFHLTQNLHTGTDVP